MSDDWWQMSSVVSIRASRFRARRRARADDLGSNGRFQSAPRAFARGDCVVRFMTESKFVFQSAPRAFARGDALRRQHAPIRDTRFQSAPRAFARGDFLLTDSNQSGYGVSIRASRFRARRPGVAQVGTKLDTFQSAPRAFARGDCLFCVFCKHLQHVSIRASRFRARRPR